MNKLPAGWQIKTVKDVCTLQNGNGFKPSEWSDAGLPIIRIQNLNGSKDFNYFAGEPKPSWLISPGEILFAWAGTRGISFGPFIWTGPQGVLNQHIFRTTPSDAVDRDWLYYSLKQLTFEIEGKAHGFKATLLHVSKGDIEKQRLLVPPHHEQIQIARIVATWDKAIATTERLLANSQQQKQALLEPLLSGRKRFAGYPAWTRTAFSKLLSESRLPGSNGEIAKKITVKLYGKGVFAKDEKRIGSESTKYYRRRAGQFIYSKLDFLNGAFGIIPEHLDGYESTLDLPAFDFSELVEPAWLLQYVSREEFYTAQLGLANGGRKARRVNPADLLGIEIPLPSRPEQQKIAQVLFTADAEIANLQAQLDKLKLEKKALMQQLLTGKRRVRLDDEEEDLAPIRRVG